MALICTSRSAKSWSVFGSRISRCSRKSRSAVSNAAKLSRMAISPATCTETAGRACTGSATIRRRRPAACRRPGRLELLPAGDDLGAQGGSLAYQQWRSSTDRLAVPLGRHEQHALGAAHQQLLLHLHAVVLGQARSRCPRSFMQPRRSSFSVLCSNAVSSIVRPSNGGQPRLRCRRPGTGFADDLPRPAGGPAPRSGGRRRSGAACCGVHLGAQAGVQRVQQLLRGSV
jgi:hypothetical protein